MFSLLKYGEKKADYMSLIVHEINNVSKGNIFEKPNYLKTAPVGKMVVVGASIMAALFPTNPVVRVPEAQHQLQTYSIHSSGKTLPYVEQDLVGDVIEFQLLSNDNYEHGQPQLVFSSNLAYNKGTGNKIDYFKEANVMAGKKQNRKVATTVGASVVFDGRMTKRPRLEFLENETINEKKAYKEEVIVPMSIEYAGRLPKRPRI